MTHSEPVTEPAAGKPVAEIATGEPVAQQAGEDVAAPHLAAIQHKYDSAMARIDHLARCWRHTPMQPRETGTASDRIDANPTTGEVVAQPIQPPVKTEESTAA
jgi:hypothetical protein